MREELSTTVSNRSAAYSEAHDYVSALADAETVISIRRNWPKGHYRKAKALLGMDRPKDAAEAVKLGLSYEPTNTVRFSVSVFSKKLRLTRGNRNLSHSLKILKKLSQQRHNTSQGFFLLPLIVIPLFFSTHGACNLFLSKYLLQYACWITVVFRFGYRTQSQTRGYSVRYLPPRFSLTSVFPAMPYNPSSRKGKDSYQ